MPFLDDNGVASSPPATPINISASSVGGARRAPKFSLDPLSAPYTSQTPSQSTQQEPNVSQPEQQSAPQKGGFFGEPVDYQPSADELQKMVSEQGYNPSNDELYTLYKADKDRSFTQKYITGPLKSAPGAVWNMIKPFGAAIGELAQKPTLEHLGKVGSSALEGISGAAAGTVGMAYKPLANAARVVGEQSGLVESPDEAQDFANWREKFYRENNVGPQKLPENIVDPFTAFALGQDPNSKAFQAAKLSPYPNLSSAISTAVSLPMIESGSAALGLNKLALPSYLGKTGTSAKAISKVAGAAEATGKAMETVGGLPERAVSAATEKVLGPKVAETIGKLPGGEAAVGGAATLLGAPHVGVPLMTLKGMETAGKGLQQVGAFAKRVAEADPTSMFGKLYTVAKDADAPEWMRVVASSKVMQGAATAAQLGAAAGKSAALGAAFGYGIGVLSGDDGQRLGESMGSGAGFGLLTAGMSAPALRKMNIYMRSLPDISRMYEEHKAMGLTDADLKNVDDHAMLWGAAAERMLADGTKVRFAPEREGSPLPQDVYGQAGRWDPATKQIWINTSAGRNPGATVLHEIFHPIYMGEVANRPDLQAQLDTAMTQRGQTLDTLKYQYIERLLNNQLAGIQDPAARDALIKQSIAQHDANSTVLVKDPNAWAYSELMSEAAPQNLFGQHPLDITNPSLASAILDPVKQFLQNIGVQFKTGPKPGTVLPDFKDVLQSPELRKMTYDLLKKQKNFMQGITQPATQGVKLTLDKWGNHPGATIGPRPDGTIGSDYVIQLPNGKIVAQPASAIKKTFRDRRTEVGTLYPERQPLPQGSQEPNIAYRITPSGLVQRSGTKLGEGFYNSRTFSKKTKDMAQDLEAAIAKGEGRSGWYQQVGHSEDWKESVARDLGNIEAQYKEFIPIDFLVDQKNNLLARNYSLTAMERKLGDWAQRHGPISLDAVGGDKAIFRSKMSQYFKNHAEGLPGEANGVGTQMRDLINAFLVGGNRTFEESNPLRKLLKGVDRQGIVRSYRLDRLETLQPNPTEFSKPSYEQQVRNFSPEIGGVYSPDVRDTNKEHVTMAALRGPDGKIWTGTTHFMAANAIPDGMYAGMGDGGLEDGFMTSAGRFVDRNEAHQLAMAANQIDVGKARKFEQTTGQEMGVRPGDLTNPHMPLESVAFGASRSYSPELEAKLAKIPGARADELPEDRGYYWLTRDGKFIQVNLHHDLADKVGIKSIYPLYHEGLLRTVVSPGGEGNPSTVWLNALQEPVVSPKQQQAIETLKDRGMVVKDGQGGLAFSPKTDPEEAQHDVVQTAVADAQARRDALITNYPGQTKEPWWKRPPVGETETGRHASYNGDAETGVVLHSAKQRSTVFLRPDKAKNFLKRWNGITDEAKRDKLVESFFTQGSGLGAESPKLANTVDEDIPLIHYSTQNLKSVDPKYFGKGSANKNDLRGAPKSYWFVAGSPLGGDEQFFGQGTHNVYGAKISGKDIYDLRYDKEDSLSYFQNPNRWEADEALKKAGYRGVMVETAPKGDPDYRHVVMLFDKQPVKALKKQPAGSLSAPMFSPPTADFEGEQIATPAVKDKDGSIYTGSFHPMIYAENKISDEAQDGFLTTSGRFVDREEASRIAANAGQLRNERAKHAITTEHLDSLDLKGKQGVTWTEAGDFEGEDRFELYEVDTGERYATVEKDGDKYKLYRGDSGRLVGTFNTLESAQQAGMHYVPGDAYEFSYSPNADDQRLTPKSFKPTPENFRKANWAILTATKEGDPNSPENINANAQLQNELTQSGYGVVPVGGSYKGVDQGQNFLVTGITPEQAQALGNKYGQESVLVPHGLLYADGTLNPVDPSKTKFGASAKKEDFYSTMPDGSAFSLGINFDKKTAYEPKTTIIRHGETDLNTGEEKIRGWAEVPLNKAGRKQADATGKRLEGSGIHTIISSDLGRAMETARIIAAHTGAQVVPDPGLRPWNLGEFTGKAVADVQPQMKFFVEHPDIPVPGGESFNQFKNRWIDAYRSIEARNPGDIAVVTHYRGTKLYDAWKQADFTGNEIDMDRFNGPNGGEGTAHAESVEKLPGIASFHSPELADDLKKAGYYEGYGVLTDKPTMDRLLFKGRQQISNPEDVPDEHKASVQKWFSGLASPKMAQEELIDERLAGVPKRNIRDKEMLAPPGKLTPVGKRVGQLAADEVRQRVQLIPDIDMRVRVRRAIKQGFGELEAVLKKQEEDPNFDTGQHWYQKDVQSMESTTKAIFPETENPTLMGIFKLMLAGLSGGLTPTENYRSAAEAFAQFLRTGRMNYMSEVREATNSGGGKLGRPAQLGRNAKESARLFNSLLQHFGNEEDLIKYLTTPQEKTLVKKLKGVPGALDMGPKFGRFFLNLMGHADEVTIDLWATRTWNRWMGTPFRKSIAKEGGAESFNVAESPAPTERKGMIEAFTKISKELNKKYNTSFTPMDVQAMLWYKERELHGAAPESFSGAAEEYQHKQIHKPGYIPIAERVEHLRNTGQHLVADTTKAPPWREQAMQALKELNPKAFSPDFGFVGVVNNEGNITMKAGKLHQIAHDYGMHSEVGGMDTKAFRYNTRTKKVYWWYPPENSHKEAVEAKFKAKGYPVASHTTMNKQEMEDEAHGNALP